MNKYLVATTPNDQYIRNNFGHNQSPFFKIYFQHNEYSDGIVMYINA